MTRSRLVVAMLCLCSAVAQAQELQEGTWSGTFLRQRARSGQNPQPQRVSLEVKRIPDPHSIWRPGKGAVLDTVFVYQNRRSAATDVVLEKTSLSFSYRRDDIQNRCALERLSDGTYEGRCVGMEDGLAFSITLIPPKAAP